MDSNPRQGVILVAERFNVAYEKSCVKRHPYETWSQDGGVRWLSVSRRMGIFKRGKGIKNGARMRSIGVHWHESCNLTPPAEQVVRFDVALGDQTASLIRDMAWWRIVCVGTRVAQCFGIDAPVRWGHLYGDRYVVVPPPSGLNRWWNQVNDGQDLSSARHITEALVRRALDPSLSHHCAVCRHPIQPLIDDEFLCPHCQETTR